MKYLVCNLKNKLDNAENLKYSTSLQEYSFKGVDLIVIPSFPFLPLYNVKNYKLGSQDITTFMDKTITGEVTGEQLKSLGVDYVIVGHSERRIYKNEINIDFINKINNAQEAGINVIYCIGESLKDMENGDTLIVLEKQISEVLNNIDLKNIIIAYEPIWAVGNKVSIDIEYISNIIKFIKDIIFEKYDIKMNVLYGGSVNNENLNELTKIKYLDGYLVGDASTKLSNVIDMISLLEN